MKLGFYGIPGPVIHQTKKRLNYEIKKLSFSVTRTITKTWLQVGIISKTCNDALYWNSETLYVWFIDIYFVIKSYFQCSQNHFAEYINKLPVTP